jgi:hypothetical protein
VDARRLVERGLSTVGALARGLRRRRRGTTPSAPASFTPHAPTPADERPTSAASPVNPASVARNIGPPRPSARPAPRAKAAPAPGAKLPPRRTAD